VNEWQETKLGELVDIGSSKRIFYEDYVIAGVPFYRSKEVIEKHNGNDITTDLFITKEKFEQIKGKYGAPQAGDLLLTSVGTLGIPYIVEEGEEFYFKDGNLTWFKNYKSNLHNKFLYYWIISSVGKNALDMMSIGSTQAALTIQGLKNLDFDLPPIEEQKAIASVLSSLDDKIGLLYRQNTTLECMAETLFRQWFVEEAQEDWEEVAITKLFDVRDGTHDSPKQKIIGKPLITSKHIDGNRLDFESAYLISDEDFDKINQRSKVDKNDILISMIGTIGLIYLEQADAVNYAIKNVGLFKTSQNTTWMAYTYFWLKSNLGRQFLDEHISGSTQEYVSLGSFRSISFKKPSSEKLNEFNQVANGYLNKIKNNSAQIQTLAKLRDNLLPKLMTGEIRIQNG
jgi:type I restriction enzyme S subunit